jgi:hypothetical protein
MINKSNRALIRLATSSGRRGRRRSGVAMTTIRSSRSSRSSSMCSIDGGGGIVRLEKRNEFAFRLDVFTARHV